MQCDDGGTNNLIAHFSINQSEKIYVFAVEIQFYVIVIQLNRLHDIFEWNWNKRMMDDPLTWPVATTRRADIHFDTFDSL